MRHIAFGDYDWTVDGFACGVELDQLPLPAVTPTILTRAGASPTFGVATIGERAIPGTFLYTGGGDVEAAYARLLARLRPTDTAPRPLRSLRNDGTLVWINAVVSFPAGARGGQGPDVTTLPVVFYAVDPHWQSVGPSGASKSFASALDQSEPVPVLGTALQDVALTLRPTAARAAATATVGWSLRQKVRVVNTSGATLANYPYALSLGNTAALVSAGKARADGNDLLVVAGGVEQARTLVGWNSASTVAWVVLPDLAAGEGATFEVWYGNASASGAPAVLGGASLPAFDLSSSSNTVWKYPVSRVAGNAGRGGWGLTSGTSVPSLTSVPGQWGAVTTKPQATDDYQTSKYVTNGTYYWADWYGQRSYKALLPLDSAMQDGDGVALVHPIGITNVYADIAYQNDEVASSGSDPVGRVVVLQSTNAQDWTPIGTVSAKSIGAVATTAPTNYPVVGAANAVAFAVWPYGSENSKKTKKGRLASGAWATTLEVTVSSAAIVQTVTQAEEAVYEIAQELRSGGDGGLVPPYTAIRVGRAYGAGRRYCCRLNEVLTIDTGSRRATLYAADGVTVVEPVPAAVLGAVRNPGSGEVVAERWMPLAQYANPLANPSFATDVTGWARTLVGSATVAALARDTGTFSAGPASGKVAVTASTVGAGGTVSVDVAADYLSTFGKAVVRAAMDLRTGNANLCPVPVVEFYDAAQAFVSRVLAPAWGPAANAWYRRTLAATVPAGASFARVGVALVSVTASQTGNVWADEVAPDGNELVQVPTGTQGTVTVGAGWFATYAG